MSSWRSIAFVWIAKVTTRDRCYKNCLGVGSSDSARTLHRYHRHVAPRSAEVVCLRSSAAPHQQHKRKQPAYSANDAGCSSFRMQDQCNASPVGTSTRFRRVLGKRFVENLEPEDLKRTPRCPGASELKWLLWYMADGASWEGEFWHGYKFLAKKLGVKPPTVQRGINHLQRIGLIKVIPRGYRERFRGTIRLLFAREEAEQLPANVVPINNAAAGNHASRQQKRDDPQSPAAAVARQAYVEALEAHHHVRSFRSPPAGTWEDLGEFLAGVAGSVGQPTEEVARVALAAFMAEKGLGDQALEKSFHRPDWWQYYQGPIEGAVRRWARTLRVVSLDAKRDERREQEQEKQALSSDDASSLAARAAAACQAAAKVASVKAAVAGDFTTAVLGPDPFPERLFSWTDKTTVTADKSATGKNPSIAKADRERLASKRQKAPVEHAAPRVASVGALA
jgi:hypothetical protein